MKNAKYIKIKPMGSYFDIDGDGYIINPASNEKLQDEWKSVIGDVLEVYKKIYKSNLINVCIRGSVAKGQAVKNISDIDSFAYVDLEKEEIDNTWRKKEEKKIIKNYPFVEGVEFSVSPISFAEKNQIMLNQSFCIYGEPLDVTRLRVNSALAIHAPYFQNRSDKSKTFYKEEKDPEKIMEYCVWQMKGLLRIGAELVINRSKKYTRDLYKCYEVFSEYYPEKETEMRRVLEIALNPTQEKEEIKDVMDNLGLWLSEETKKYF